MNDVREVPGRNIPVVKVYGEVVLVLEDGRRLAITVAAGHACRREIDGMPGPVYDLPRAQMKMRLLPKG